MTRHLRGDPGLPQLSVDEDGHPVAQFQSLVQIVGHVHDRRAQLPVEALDLRAQLQPGLTVEGGEGLVQQEDFGLDGQRAGQSDPLLLPA